MDRMKEENSILCIPALSLKRDRRKSLDTAFTMSYDTYHIIYPPTGAIELSERQPAMQRHHTR